MAKAKNHHDALSRLRDMVESREFYEAMQTYRFAAPSKPAEVVAAFEAVKTLVLDAVTANRGSAKSLTKG